MTKTATTPIYGKNSLKSFSPKPKGGWPWDLVFSIWDVGPTKFAHMNILGWLILTYFSARSNLIPNAFIWGRYWCAHFSKKFKAKIIVLARNVNLMRRCFYISTKCQADLWPFIKGHSFGLPHSYLKIFYFRNHLAVWTQFHMEYYFDCFRSLHHYGHNNHIW